MMFFFCFVFFNHYCLCLLQHVMFGQKYSSSTLYLYLLTTSLTSKLKLELFSYKKKQQKNTLSFFLSQSHPKEADPLYCEQAGMGSYGTLVIKRGAEWASLSLFASQSTTQCWCYANEHCGEGSAPKTVLSLSLFGERARRSDTEPAQGNLMMQPENSEQVKWLYFVMDVAAYECGIKYLLPLFSTSAIFFILCWEYASRYCAAERVKHSFLSSG